MKQMTLLVSGKVQGVFFRLNTEKQAKDLGLSGYVENLEDNRVKIVAQGKDKNLNRLISWAKEGPRLAQVDSLEIKKVLKKNSQFDDFVIKR